MARVKNSVSSIYSVGIDPRRLQSAPVKSLQRSDQPAEQPREHPEELVPRDCSAEQKHYPAGTSTSTNVRPERQKSTLFQWLAVPLWVPTGKDRVPTDSGHSVRVLLDPAAPPRARRSVG